MPSPGSYRPIAMSGGRSLTHRLVWAILLGMSLSSLTPHPTQASCVADTIGPDPTKTTGTGSLIWCEAWGQTFFARDTLIRSITVWKPVIESFIVPMKLWITNIHPVFLYPATEDVLLDGPTIAPQGDGISYVECKFVLDPPFALPAANRTYTFYVQELCDVYIDLLVDAHGDDYPEGSLWRTGRSCGQGCSLGVGTDALRSYDLIFQLEFCRDAATATFKSTWGELKVRYR